MQKIKLKKICAENRTKILQYEIVNDLHDCTKYVPPYVVYIMI